MEWQEAYEKAGFYQSDTNKADYWDKLAQIDGGGLAGTGHIELIRDYLIHNKFLGADSHVLDIGCGGGDYVTAFAPECGHVTAMDYSALMLDACRKRCEDLGIDNVSYLYADFDELQIDHKYDCVMSCLNPATYNPCALNKMLLIAKRCVVYFTMDIAIEGSEKEPIYRGCNSVRYAQEYLKKNGYTFRKLPYLYSYHMPDGTNRDIPFAFLAISLINC
ncbi:class I SAM-dependent methyltransferase [Butyrivibrio sp. MC2013]|uniref:class I SAM-dependent methyltransferase n=1 Tax=Butyrivibrio sp. MC2013 TaxID=1280686 RepID=UPI000401A05C|nr:class I SAM-dependent methyltransferase [Butyrivibrio sp. MC2013]